MLSCVCRVSGYVVGDTPSLSAVFLCLAVSVVDLVAATVRLRGDSDIVRGSVSGAVLMMLLLV